MSHAAPPTPPSRGPREWTAEQRAKIDEIVARYPTKKAAVMPVLWLAQETFDWLDLDVMRLVGKTLELPPSHVHAVASFYTMFKKQPTGRYVIDVCHTLSCALVGADRIVAHLEKVLEVDAHGNSRDGLFTLHRVECLASCGSAPMMQVNDHFYEFLTPERVDEIVAAFRAGSPLPTPRPEANEWQWNSPRS
jgi:NADH-quinone oxidoreductase subunit E